MELLEPRYGVVQCFQQSVSRRSRRPPPLRSGGPPRSACSVNALRMTPSSTIGAWSLQMLQRDPPVLAEPLAGPLTDHA